MGCGCGKKTQNAQAGATAPAGRQVTSKRWRVTYADRRKPTIHDNRTEAQLALSKSKVGGSISTVRA